MGWTGAPPIIGPSHGPMLLDQGPNGELLQRFQKTDELKARPFVTIFRLRSPSLFEIPIGLSQPVFRAVRLEVMPPMSPNIYCTMYFDPPKSLSIPVICSSDPAILDLTSHSSLCQV